MRFLVKNCLALLILVSVTLVSACHQQDTKALYSALITNTAGNPSGDITLVEFYDPLCSDCRQMTGILEEVIANEPRLRVVYREIPIAEPFSDTVIRTLLAAKLQDRYLAVRQLIMTGKAPTEDKTLLKLAAAAQTDPKVLAKDRQNTLVSDALLENQNLAKIWQVQGTPTFFIGKQNHTPLRLEGTQTKEELVAAINQAKGS